MAGIVDIPNACTTLGLPMDIFAFDISPDAAVNEAKGKGGEEGKEKRDMGRCAFESGRVEGVVLGVEDREGGKGEVSFGGGLSYKK